MTIPLSKRLSTLLSVLAVAATVSFQGAADDNYSPNLDRSKSTQVLWGDTHLHTNLSVDSSGFGNDRLTPDEAYKFAKGQKIRAHNGQEARLKRPLDFLVVADHAVNIGVIPRILAKDPLVLNTKIGQEWAARYEDIKTKINEALNAETVEEYQEKLDGVYGARRFYTKSWTTDYIEDKAFRQSVWDEVCANAERHNDPGKFTAFIGYEWTPATSDEFSPNLHRNLIFEGGADEAMQVLPFSVQDSRNVEDLWAYMQDYEDRIGGKVLCIPHNGNLSSGVMFGPNDYNGNPISSSYMKARARWEPLYEVTQIKGDSETLPFLSPDDEFADFERWEVPGFYPEKSEDWEELKPYEYARSAFKLGLNRQVDDGINPYKFGMIGSTDAHTSISSVEEDNFWGKLSFYEPSPFRLNRGWHFSASGYAAVWATENTRESIFAAMRRKETYATTGPRITVRFFGGWDYESDDAFRKNLAEIGYAKGVPMGGDLTRGPEDTAPNFLIRAVKDPDGANLDRVQVIKGWRDRSGTLHEKVYDVALSDGRKITRNRTPKSVGNTVDVKDASYTNSIGDAEFAAVWTDPNFDADQHAFYYVRVIQIPTPRWTAFDAKYFELEDVPEEAPMTVQDRAYTSPIWYTP
jgi:hypothetical protein